MRNFLVVVTTAAAVYYPTIWEPEKAQSLKWHTQVNIDNLTNIKTGVGATCTSVDFTTESEQVFLKSIATAAFSPCPVTSLPTKKYIVL